jgi:hypothetical protein
VADLKKQVATLEAHIGVVARDQPLAALRGKDAGQRHEDRDQAQREVFTRESAATRLST